MSIDKLIERDQWVLWKKVTHPESKSGETKVPVGANGRATSIMNKKCFKPFERAYNSYINNQDLFDGIGFIFTEDDPFVGIDLDSCHRWNGWQEIVKKCASYAEISPSKTGIHIIMEGVTPGESHSFKIGSHANGGIEIYDANRYLTMSLDPLENFTEVIKNQDAIDWIVKTCNDHSVFARIAKTEYSKKVESLFTGNWSGLGYASQSEADLALCRILGNIGCPMHQIDRIFRKSKLMRPKWNERRGKSTYGKDTLNLALSNRKE